MQRNVNTCVGRLSYLIMYTTMGTENDHSYKSIVIIRVKLKNRKTFINAFCEVNKNTCKRL